MKLYPVIVLFNTFLKTEQTINFISTEKKTQNYSIWIHNNYDNTFSSGNYLTL